MSPLLCPQCESLMEARNGIGPVCHVCGNTGTGVPLHRERPKRKGRALVLLLVLVVAGAVAASMQVEDAFSFGTAKDQAAAAPEGTSDFGNDGGATGTGNTGSTDAGNTYGADPGEADGGTASPPEPLEFSGTGDHVTTSFITEQALLRVSMSHGGSSNFVVWLGDEALFANEVGNYDGSGYFAVPPGEHRLDINADGAWAVRIEQPADAGQAPSQQTGEGDVAIPAMQFQAGVVVFELEYEGESKFIVRMFDATGQAVALIANENGEYSGDQRVQIPRDGVYYIDVEAQGTWQIDF